MNRRGVLLKLIKRIMAVIRGVFFRLFYRIGKGNLLQVFPGVHINCFRKNAIVIDEKVILYHDVGLYIDSKDATIKIGKHTYINRRSEIRCQKEVRIGDYCAISWDVSIMDSDYHSINENVMSAPIIIGDHVWIGCKSIILKGVTIGDGAIVAAGSIVNNNVPANTLVGGNPAKILRENVSWE